MIDKICALQEEFNDVIQSYKTMKQTIQSPILFCKQMLKVLLLVAAMSLLACTPDPQSMLPKVQSQAEQYLKGLHEQDASLVQKFIHPALLSLFDGRVEELLSARNNGFMPLTNQGFRLVSTRVGEPQSPQKAEKFYVSFVPFRTTFLYDDGGNIGKMRLFGPTRIDLTMYLAAISSDSGKSWKFFEVGEDKILMDEILPGLSEKLVFPSELVRADKQ
jgi:hypothetical protein